MVAPAAMPLPMICSPTVSPTVEASVRLVLPLVVEPREEMPLAPKVRLFCPVDVTVLLSRIELIPVMLAMYEPAGMPVPLTVSPTVRPMVLGTVTWLPDCVVAFKLPVTKLAEP